MFFKNLTVFRMPKHWAVIANDMEAALKPLEYAGIQKHDFSAFGFVIDGDHELVKAVENKQKIKYIGGSPDVEAISSYISNGRVCTSLALTWADRISFVLTEKFKIKRVIPLDVLTQNREGFDKDSDVDVFNSDFSMMTGELNLMLQSLITAFGGERDKSEDGASNAND